MKRANEKNIFRDDYKKEVKNKTLLETHGSWTS